jgi:hypothetical protein
MVVGEIAKLILVLLDACFLMDFERFSAKFATTDGTLDNNYHYRSVYWVFS